MQMELRQSVIVTMSLTLLKVQTENTILLSPVLLDHLLAEWLHQTNEWVLQQLYYPVHQMCTAGQIVQPILHKRYMMKTLAEVSVFQVEPSNPKSVMENPEILLMDLMKTM